MLKKCCWYLPLRTGNIILSILGLMETVILLGFPIWIIHGFLEPWQLRSLEIENRKMPIWPNIIQANICFLAYGFLLFGTIRRNNTAILMYLSTGGMLIALALIRITMEFVSIETVVPIFADDCAQLRTHYTNFNCEDMKTSTVRLSVALLITCTILNLYSWICSYSFYKEIKLRDGNLP